MGNPAQLEGLLFECDAHYIRKGLHQPLFADRAVLLSNGKLAVDNSRASKFISEGAHDERLHDFHNPCPPTEDRIKAHDDHADSLGTPKFATLAPVSQTDANVVVSKYAVQADDRRLFASLIMIVNDSDMRAHLETASRSSGTKLIELLKAEADKATSKDKVYVVAQRDAHVSAGVSGELNLDGFNVFYREFQRLQRGTPLVARSSDETVVQMIHNIIFRDQGFGPMFELKLTVAPPEGLAATVTLVRDMLRSRKVSQQLSDISPGGASAHTALAAAAQVAAHARANGSPLSTAQLAQLAQARTLLAAPDPRKTMPRDHKPKPDQRAKTELAAKSIVHVPRDSDNRVISWVPGMLPCVVAGILCDHWAGATAAGSIR